MPIISGQSFTATLENPGGLQGPLGARIEVPVTRAIVSAFTYATFDGDQLWSVTIAAPVLVSPATEGDFNLVWMTTQATPLFEAFVPIHVVTSQTAVDDFPVLNLVDITPSVGDVAKIMRTRTRDESGMDQGTFTSTTFPKDTDVTSLISDALQAVAADIPNQLDPLLYDQAKWAVTLQTAILIETSFFRVQGATGTSPLPTYQRQLIDTLGRLTPTTTQYDGLF